MIDMIKNIFKRKNKGNDSEYTGLSDFLLRASPEEKKKIITEAARRANSDQLEIFNKSLKTKTKCS